MAKYCAKCGAQVADNAIYCQVCGAHLSQQQSYDQNQAKQPQGSVPPQQPPYPQQPFQQNYQTPPQQANQHAFFLLQEISNKLRNVAIIWLITGILQIIFGVTFFAADHYFYRNSLGGFFVVVSGICNIVFAGIHFGYSKNIITNPASVLRTFDTSASYITNLVYNAIFGAIFGIAGAIYALTIRSFVKSNMYYLQKEGYYTPGYYDMPPQQPPYQKGNYHTPPYNPYTQAPPNQYSQQKQKNQQEQPTNTNEEEQTKNPNDDQSNQ